MKFLKKLKSPHYLTGFNATQSKEDDTGYSPKCYDMNFIIKKAGLNKNLFRTVK